MHGSDGIGCKSHSYVTHHKLNRMTASAKGPQWLATNPSKRWTELFFLAYSPFWILWALCILVPFQLFEVRHLLEGTRKRKSTLEYSNIHEPSCFIKHKHSFTPTATVLWELGLHADRHSLRWPMLHPTHLHPKQGAQSFTSNGFVSRTSSYCRHPKLSV